MGRTLLVGFLVLASVFLSEKARAEVCGRIASFRGQIEVLRVKEGSDPSAEDSARVAILAQKRMRLQCSDIVVTRQAARAKLRFVNKSVLTLGPHSRLEILDYLRKKSDVSQLKLTYGKVRAFLKPSKKMVKKLPEKGEKTKSRQSRFFIKTPSAVAGVRGTDFFISHNPITEQTSQATITGEVEVEQAATGQKVIVRPGKQVEIKELKPDVAKEIKKKIAEGADLDELQKISKDFIPLTSQPIQPETKEVIRQTSAIAKNDKNFASKAAEKLLGKASSWNLPPDEVPLDLKELKEEF